MLHQSRFTLLQFHLSLCQQGLLLQPRMLTGASQRLTDQPAHVLESPSNNALVGDPPGWQEETTSGNATGSSGVPAAVPAPAAEVLARLGRLLQDLQDDRHSLFGQTNAVQLVESDDEDDPQRVSEYVVNICDRLEELEAVDAHPSFIGAQPEIDANVRGAALDWLVEVHCKFQLQKETLFLAVSLFDRFLATKTVKRKDLQLIIVSAVFIAAKFEEIDPPDVRDFVLITKQACTKEAIFSMEVNMLTALEFVSAGRQQHITVNAINGQTTQAMNTANCCSTCLNWPL